MDEAYRFLKVGHATTSHRGPWPKFFYRFTGVTDLDLAGQIASLSPSKQTSEPSVDGQLDSRQPGMGKSTRISLVAWKSKYVIVLYLLLYGV